MTYIKTTISTLFVFTLFIGCGSGTTTSSVKEIEKTIEHKEAQQTTTKTIEDKLFHIVSKTTHSIDENITTIYTYKNRHLSKEESSSTTGLMRSKEYKYFQDYQVVKTYDSNNLVKSVAIFTELKNPTKRYEYDNRLSLNEKINYVLLPYDSLSILDKKHISKLIYPDTTGNIYTYDEQDNLLNISNGYFDDNGSRVFSQIEDDVDIRSDELKFVLEQSTDYLYDDIGRLGSVEFKGASEFKTAVDVSFYDNGSLKDINISTGGSFNYSKNGLLKKKVKIKNGTKSTLNYTYSSDFKTISIKNDSGKLVTIYKFEEI